MVSKKRFNLILILLCFAFSWWLFGKSFGYDGQTFRIARHQVGDFGLHLSIIRSISWGSNFPPQSPFFPGLPLPYHWGVDVFVGVLERLGLRIDWALNGVSALAMTALLYGVYQFSQTVFGRHRLVGLVAIALFLFPSTLTIVDYLKSPQNFWRLPDYIHKGPFDGSMISIYQTLNPYLNQRHLVVGMAIGLFIINASIASTSGSIILGIMLGLLFKIHSLIAVSTLVIIVMFFLFYKKKFPLLLSAVALLMWALFVRFEHSQAPPISFYLGYLASGNIIQYWWANAGLSLLLLPIGLFLAPRKARIIFLSFVPIFIIANTFKLSFRIEHNHSLVNFFWIAVSVYVAFTLAKIFERSKVVAVVLFGILISSGILNLMAVKNDYQTTFPDAPLWIKNNTRQSSVFLTNPTLYDPATLAGRFTYVGPSYYLEVMGIDFREREQFSRKFFATPNESFVSQARGRGIDYVIVPRDVQMPLKNIFENEKIRVYEI